MSAYLHPFITLDTETNGFKNPVRLASLSADLVIEGNVIHEVTALIKPDGWVMDPEASAKNGLTQEMLEALGLPIRDVLLMFSHFFRAVEPEIVGFNTPFDLDRVLIPECERLDEEPFAFLHAALTRHPRVCMMNVMRPICQAKDARGNVKAPKLVEAYRHVFGQDYDGAHQASADRIATAKLYRWHLDPGGSISHIARTDHE